MEPITDKNYSKLEWMFYIIILPVMFISILTGVLLWLLDYDMKTKFLETLNQIPVIEKLIDEENINSNSELPSLNKEQLQLKIEELSVTLNEKNQTLSLVEKEVFTKDEEINQLKEQVKILEEQLKKKIVSDQNREAEIADLAKIYANMNPKNAANIISNLTSTEAVMIFAQMSVEAKSKILEKMDPVKAADLSILLKDQKYSKEQDISALQERINLLTQEIEQLKSTK